MSSAEDAALTDRASRVGQVRTFELAWVTPVQLVSDAMARGSIEWFGETFTVVRR